MKTWSLQPSKHQTATARDVTINESSRDEKEFHHFHREPEYISQWESEDDGSGTDSVAAPVKGCKAATKKKEYNIAEKVSEITQEGLGDI